VPLEVGNYGSNRGFLTPEERARITELQDLLIDRFVEHREAVAAGKEERVKNGGGRNRQSSARKGRDREVGGCRVGLVGGTPTRTSGSSIYPAVQNTLLAARALGLGATLTTLYLQFEKEAEATLGLTPGVDSHALLPVGYPMGRFGAVRRIALADVVSEDQGGQSYRDL
jgi:nitroreductase